MKLRRDGLVQPLHGNGHRRRTAVGRGDGKGLGANVRGAERLHDGSGVIQYITPTPGCVDAELAIRAARSRLRYHNRFAQVGIRHAELPLRGEQGVFLNIALLAARRELRGIVHAVDGHRNRVRCAIYGSNDKGLDLGFTGLQVLHHAVRHAVGPGAVGGDGQGPEGAGRSADGGLEAGFTGIRVGNGECAAGGQVALAVDVQVLGYCAGIDTADHGGVRLRAHGDIQCAAGTGLGGVRHCRQAAMPVGFGGEYVAAVCVQYQTADAGQGCGVPRYVGGSGNAEAGYPKDVVGVAVVLEHIATCGAVFINGLALRTEHGGLVAGVVVVQAQRRSCRQAVRARGTRQVDYAVPVVDDRRRASHASPPVSRGKTGEQLKGFCDFIAGVLLGPDVDANQQSALAVQSGQCRSGVIRPFLAVPHLKRWGRPKVGVARPDVLHD